MSSTTPTPKFTTYPGYGEWAAENLHYSQAVRIGDRVYTSGQGGWNPTSITSPLPESLSEEIERAFLNVELALRSAGVSGGWKNVYKVRSYHVGWEGDVGAEGAEDGPTGIMVQMLRKYCGERRPIWTEVGAKRLGMESMRVEIEVEAFVGGGEGEGE